MTTDDTDEMLQPTASSSPPSPYPFSTVEDLSQCFLWPLLYARQQRDTLSIADRAERHRWFAACLATNGYGPDQAEPLRVPDLVLAISNYLATVDDDEKLREAGGLTQREVALSELMAFLRWTGRRRAADQGAKE